LGASCPCRLNDKTAMAESINMFFIRFVLKKIEIL